MTARIFNLEHIHTCIYRYRYILHITHLYKYIDICLKTSKILREIITFWLTMLSGHCKLDLVVGSKYQDHCGKGCRPDISFVIVPKSLRQHVPSGSPLASDSKFQQHLTVRINLNLNSSTSDFAMLLSLLSEDSDYSQFKYTTP